MKQVRENIQQTSYVPYFQPQIKNLFCQAEKITAFLEDGRELSIPTTWFSRLRKATLNQLTNYQILPDGYHVH